MNYKDEYIAFCKSAVEVPLFHQPQWWDVVANDWHVMKFESHNAFAFLPFHIERKLFFTMARNPLLTPYSGLLFCGDYSLPQRQKLFDSAKEFLNQFSLSEYDGNPRFTNGIRSSKTKSTYLLSLEISLAQIEKNFKPSLRRQLRKAEKNLDINECTDTKLFYEVYLDSISRQSKANRTPKELVDEVFSLCHDKKLGHIFTAVDQDNKVHSAIWYLEDADCAYYLLGGSRKEFLGSGAMGFLLWHCIRIAHARGKKIFDFEGSEVPGVAKFFSTFGGERVCCPVLRANTNGLLKLLIRLKG